MKKFEHANATSVAGAVSLLGSEALAMPIAGGTDLLTRIKLGLVRARPAREFKDSSGSGFNYLR